ncbi:MAG: hypothetical protein K6U88_14505, partial [Dehalococcoidia bacterium]|nr:hypothetical protein [Dehalococcoidia bacterium]
LLAGAFGQLAGGALAERHALERLVPLQALALAPGLLLIGALSGFVLVPVVGAFVFAYFAGQPIFTSLIADYSPPDALGRSYGFTFFAAFGLGSGAATFAGFFADRWGTDAVFFALAGVAALTFALTLRIWRYGEERADAARRQAIPVD